ncbi:MAG: hypothetical protein JW795_13890, partial [Chitinivibrionales bacterium]|nr:hypothetical protein [Chitinivibrionales bacterium]
MGNFGRVSNLLDQVTATDRAVYSVIYHNGRYIAVGSDRTIQSSTDCKTWLLEMDVLHNYHLISITFGRDLYVTVGRMGTILTSTDGKIWTARNSNVSQHLYSVVYGNNRFVALGMKGLVLVSDDGVTWTKYNAGISAEFSEVIHANGRFYAVGANGVIASSTDGASWCMLQTQCTSNVLYGLICVNDQFVAVGEGGTIITSAVDKTASKPTMAEKTTSGRPLAVTAAGTYMTITGAALTGENEVRVELVSSTGVTILRQRCRVAGTAVRL